MSEGQKRKEYTADNLKKKESDLVIKLKENKVEKKREKSRIDKKKDKKDEERRLAEESIDENIEFAELEATRNFDEEKDQYKGLYSTFSPDIYEAYDKIKSFSRNLNIQLRHPEIVLIGPTSHGKSSILEALVGFQFNCLGLNGVTKRPLFLNFMNNLSSTQPKVTLRRDSLLQSFDHDVRISLDALPAELSKRLAKESKDPVFIQYEHNLITNMTFIDTPGLPDEDSPEYEGIHDIILNLIKPAHRIVICVEEANEWSKIRTVKLVKSIDCDLSRTMFAFTKFYSQLNLLNSTSASNRFFAGIPVDIDCFFVTLPCTKIRARYNGTNPEPYQGKVWQAYRRDIIQLEILQYDRQFKSKIGVQNLRKNLTDLIWKEYRECIPQILKVLRNKKDSNIDILKFLEEQKSSLIPNKLRYIATNYIVEYLQTIERLISGSSEGSPCVSGQTLEEEKTAQGDMEWVDMYNHKIIFDAEKWNVPHWNSHLYGGQQFERLLSEFKLICDHTEMTEVSMDDITTAAGINKINNVPNYTWAVADFVQHYSRNIFSPLISQLNRRTIYILRRLHSIAEKGLAIKYKKYASKDYLDVGDINLYPYFTNQVKDFFFKFIDDITKECSKRCQDEFYSSKTIFWELIEFSGRKLPVDRLEKNPEEIKVSVIKLVSDLFRNIRDRISHNILLKFYNFILVPVQTDLWNEIQSKITTVSDDQLDQLFQIKIITERIEAEIKDLKALSTKIQTDEEEFLKYAKILSNPLIPVSTPVNS